MRSCRPRSPRRSRLLPPKIQDAREAMGSGAARDGSALEFRRGRRLSRRRRWRRSRRRRWRRSRRRHSSGATWFDNGKPAKPISVMAKERSPLPMMAKSQISPHEQIMWAIGPEHNGEAGGRRRRHPALPGARWPRWIPTRTAAAEDQGEARQTHQFNWRIGVGRDGAATRTSWTAQSGRRRGAAVSGTERERERERDNLLFHFSVILKFTLPPIRASPRALVYLMN